MSQLSVISFSNIFFYSKIVQIHPAFRGDFGQQVLQWLSKVTRRRCDFGQSLSKTNMLENKMNKS